MTYDCIIVGGGIAGLQASILFGRYKRSVLVIDSSDGRSNRCRKYNNILGFDNGVSGKQLRETGRKQAESYGIHFLEGKVTHVHKDTKQFTVHTQRGESFSAKTMLLSTGVKDNIPPFPGLEPCLGLSVYICPDCDGYEIKDKKTIVMGSGDKGASMALALLYWSSDILLINHDGRRISRKLRKKLKLADVKVEKKKVRQIIQEKGIFQGVELTDGQRIEGEKGFAAFGGNAVHSELAKSLGAKSLKNNHLVVDPHTKMTTVNNLWAAGDVVAHSELVSVAMGEGAQAAIFIHKQLFHL
ncbi:NAD(P)/FAD-dependent oxidoreductase [Halobacillus sp. Marseille-Q1614]|uniref:NAD(P)/FAD-dependent oxidoreductase n=1 Tax=Halobacillus sp. Marseille-Q1614 TaxID=2709134 RepID=UPI00156D6AC9|nr:NAD(P)/FAD-dependent oxidoreductase [Halobacillus sp. Marseille-Q1614]